LLPLPTYVALGHVCDQQPILRASLIDLADHWLGRAWDGGGPRCCLTAQPMGRHPARLRRPQSASREQSARLSLLTHISSQPTPRQPLYLLLGDMRQCYSTMSMDVIARQNDKDVRPCPCT